MVSHNFFTLIIFIVIMGAGTIIHYIVLSASESGDDPHFFAIPWAAGKNPPGRRWDQCWRLKIKVAAWAKPQPIGGDFMCFFCLKILGAPPQISRSMMSWIWPVHLKQKSSHRVFFLHKYEVSSSFWTNPGLLQLSGGQMIATRGALAPERWESTLCWWEFWSKVVESQKRPWGS